MSYRNPQQVVDTQSGQHVQNMLKQITGATTGAIKTIQAKYKQREKENIERVQKLNSAQGKFLNAYNAADIKNSATDWQTGLGVSLTRHGELIKKQLNDPLKFTTDNAKELSWLQTLPNQILEDAKQTEAKMQSYNDTMEIPPGNFGGIDKFAPPELFKTLDIEGQVGSTAGRSIGIARWDPELSKGSTKVVSYDGQGNEIGTDANRAFDIPVVPNPTTNIKEVGGAFAKANVNYYKEEVKTKRIPIKDGEGKVTGAYTQEYKEVEMDRLIADVRKKTDSYIIGLGAQPASRLSNNTMLEYIDEIPTMPGMLGVGDMGKIIDPDKATWDMDATGKVVDPLLERTQIAYAKMVIKEEGLGVEKYIRRIDDKTGDKKTIKLSAAEKKLKNQSQFTNKILNEVDENQAKTGNPSAADSFLSLTNKYIPDGEPKIEQLDDIKERYIKYMTTVPKIPLSKEEAEAEWQEKNIKTSLAYIKNGEVISIDPSSAESRTSALEDLLITNPKILAKYNLSKANKNRPELP